MKLHSNRRSYDKRRSRPQNAENKNPKVMAGSLAAIVISAVILCMVVIIGIVGFVGHGANTVTTAATATPSAGNPVHCWFFVDSNELGTDTEVLTMKGSCFQKDGISYLPADGIATGLGGTVHYDKEKGTLKFSDLAKSAKVTVDSDKMKVGLFRRVTLSAPVMEKDGVVYIPARDFLEALGYGLTYSAPTKRMDAFLKKGGSDEAPTAKFSTDKDTYNVGEKIVYTTENSSPQGYDIVEEKWENRASWYFESGDRTITYSVKDYRGNWSETVSKTIHIEGEYYGAETVPVLCYYYITPDSDEISTVVKKERKITETVTDPDDPTKTIEQEKTEYYNETVRGRYYGDDMVISVDQFEEEMYILSELGCKTLTVSEYLEYADSGVMPPEGSVLILFVGGYESTFTQAYPILQDYGFKANVAPVVKMVEDRSALSDAVAAGEEGAEDQLDAFDDECRFTYLTFEEISELGAQGYDVGAYSYDSNKYGDSAALLAAPTGDEDEAAYEKRVQDDLANAMKVLNSRIDDNEPFFVYPYDETSEYLIEAVEKANYSSAFVVSDEPLTAESERFKLEGIIITQDMSGRSFENLF